MDHKPISVGVFGPARLYLILAAYIAVATGNIPLPSRPDWNSQDNDYTTGGSFAFINSDRFLDLCTSNGNDMALNRNGVYLNNNGTLEQTASWRSSDQGYFGHCYTGDIDNDGYEDLAVAYLGNAGAGELVARVYRNTGSGLASAPFWKAKDKHSSFDCCLGDVDLDGDLDLAISAGDAYQNETDSVRIYRNNAGRLDTLPFWTAKSGFPSDAVRFCDIDNDGDLDLFVGQVIPAQKRGLVTMYRNDQGALNPAPAWTAQAGIGWVLRLAFGDYDQDGWLDLAVASNGQNGEPSSIKVFRNSQGTLDTLARYTMLRKRRYSSCVAWADVNGDGYPELAAGGWWEPLVVFENRAGTLDTVPSWSWSPSIPTQLVCETVVWADIANRHLVNSAATFSGNGRQSLFTLPHRPLHRLDSILVNGRRLPSTAYCHDPLAGWFSLALAPDSGTGNVTAFYSYSSHPDLLVTNWVAAQPNYLFRNTTPVGICHPSSSFCPPVSCLTAEPNPFRSHLHFLLAGASSGIDIYDATGRLVRFVAAPANQLPPTVLMWDGCDNAGRALPAGLYVAVERKTGTALRLVRVTP